MENFDLRSFLIENKLTTNSKLLSEQEIDEIDVRKLGRNLAAGAAMLAGTVGAQGQEAPKQRDYQKSIDSIQTVTDKTPQQKRALTTQWVKARNAQRLDPIQAAQKKRIDNWIADHPGKDEKDYWDWQEDRQKGPDAQPDGLEVGKACKSGEKKGSCVDGGTRGGDSLKNIRR
jgi:hypothetical protein